MSVQQLTRRGFLSTAAIAGGGLMIGIALPGCSSEKALPVRAASNALVPNAFLQILPDNKVIFYSGSDEMGQGAFTGLATLIGEELDLDPGLMQVEHAPGIHPDYANPAFGFQLTGGSSSIRGYWQVLRQAGADARVLLVSAAAQDLGVSVADIRTDNGHIVVNGERYPYGQFLATAAGLPVPQGTPLKSPAEFKYIGAQRDRVDTVQKSTGTATFGMDAYVDGMQHAVVVRSPVAGAKPLSFAPDTVLARKGVNDVVPISSGIAIVADKYWQAKAAAATLEVAWETVPLSQVSTESVKRDLLAALDSDDATASTEEGDLAAGFASATQRVEQDYWAPFLAHAPMEPLNATLTFENGEAELWTGAQSVQGAIGIVARVLDIEPDKVRLHNLYLGGGFGRRGTLTHLAEVAEIVKAVKRPVKLMWSREDDIRNGLYRPASMMRISAGVNSDGQITAWHAKRAGGNITPDTLRYGMPTLMPSAPEWLIDIAADAAGWMMKNLTVDHPSVEGLHENYSVPNKRVEHVTVDHGLPLTFWRSVGHSYTAFATESAIDELAIAANMDPVELRLRNTGGNPRLQNVIKIAGERMRELVVPEGHHLGFAAQNSFFTDVAEIAEVSVEGGQIRVHRVICVVDCGIAVNPDIVRAQMEGGVNFALTAALHGELNLEQGRITESNFHDYPILRMDEAPAIEVIIVDSGTDPTGVGEPGVPPLAPAVANAVFRATGQRLRSLPLRLA